MKKNTLIWGGIFVVFIGLVVWLIMTPGKPSKLDGLATCIKDSGTTFYGAFWCPHCQAQKALFGPSAELLPYIECSNPDGQSQNQVCNNAKVESYPTWQFPDGSRLLGEQSLVDLAQKTQCPLPE